MILRREVSPGIQECTIDLSHIYDTKERSLFEKRWRSFYTSDPDNKKILKRKGDKLIYLSEEIVPTKKDSRTPLLLVFGNPAPRSVVSGMYFSYEGNGREHRVWKAFRETGIADISGTPQEKKRKVLDLDYDSPFRIGLTVFFSFPTTPSKPPWTGVAGIYRLFGKKAAEIIAQDEREHLEGIMKEFLGGRGAVLAFQKDAYERLKDRGARVRRLPPTRLIHGAPARKALRTAVKDVVRHARTAIA